jgi:transcriptional regulator with XRE-family HTH domain
MTLKRPLAIDRSQIGQLIRQLRLEMGLTQEQLARELGVTYSSVNRWENGRSKPSPLARQKIEQMLKLMSDRDEI